MEVYEGCGALCLQSDGWQWDTSLHSWMRMLTKACGSLCEVSMVQEVLAGGIFTRTPTCHVYGGPASGLMLDGVSALISDMLAAMTTLARLDGLVGVSRPEGGVDHE